jgi:transposase
MPGTDTSRFACWRTPSWWSFASSPPATKQSAVKGGARSRPDPAERAGGQEASARHGRACRTANFRFGWSVWRRAYQAVVARCKKASRAARRVLCREESPEGRTDKVSALLAEGGPLADEEWEMVEPLIPQKPPAGRPYHDHRTVLGGIVWVMRTGSSWREMPEEFDKWESAYRSHGLWVKQGLWERILQALGEKGFPGPQRAK